MDLGYLKNKKILFVDDEPELLSMVEGILEKEGYQNIRRAASVKEALEVFQEWTPEMAVLDVMLPDGDGFGLLKRSGSDRTFPCCFSPQEERRKINFWGWAWEQLTIL